jgi:hypothetical protein
MAKKQQPHWQPISALPLLAESVDGMLESAEEQLPNLQAAQSKPHVMDDYTVGRVTAVYTGQRNDLWIYKQQLTRWEKTQLTLAQRQEVERLKGQVTRLREVLQELLSIAADLKEKTIEKVLGKSDLEVGLDVLTGKLKL